MNDAVINIKTNKALKIKATKIAADLGFTLSTLINAYLRSLVRNKSVDFSMAEAESHPSNMMIKAMKENDAEKKSGKGVSFSTGEEAIRFLNDLIKHDENRILKKLSKTNKKSFTKNSNPISRQANYLSV